jgi:hypothetical protein
VDLQKALDMPPSHRGILDHMDSLEHAIAQTRKLLEASCDKLGIDVASVPGYNNTLFTLPPSSTNLQSAFSPGIQVTNLTISNTYSIGSSHSSLRSGHPGMSIQ